MAQESQHSMISAHEQALALHRQDVLNKEAAFHELSFIRCAIYFFIL